MTDRRASVVACDNILFDVTGKIYLHGLYPADITIPGDELIVNQLMFYFTLLTPKERPFKNVTLKVTPPQQKTVELQIPVAAVQHVKNPDRPMMILRAPLLVQQLVLMLGKIETKAFADDEELDAGGIWVTTVPKLT
jgi:hypothetical protein